MEITSQKADRQPGSLFITIDPDNQPFIISKNGQGDDGFISFVNRNLDECCLREEGGPSYLMLHYEFKDRSLIPPIHSIDNTGYLQKLFKNSEELGYELKHVLSLYDAFYCLREGIPFLSERSVYQNKIDREMWRSLDDLRYRFDDKLRLEKDFTDKELYFGVQTDEELKAISISPEGIKMRDAYLQYLVNRMFDPHCAVQTLRLWEMYAHPEKIEGKSDFSKSGRTQWFPISESMLEDAFCTHEYDLRPTGENFLNFASSGVISDFIPSEKNLTVAQLLYMAETGRVDRCLNFGLHAFPYKSDFDAYFKNLPQCPPDSPEAEKLGREVKVKARFLLDRYWPHLRQPNLNRPPLVRQGITTYYRERVGFPSRIPSSSMEYTRMQYPSSVKVRR